MQSLKQAMPTLARHEGVWEGQCRYFDADGRLIDQHQSRLTCSFPSDGPYPYLQTNVYRWADVAARLASIPRPFATARFTGTLPRSAAGPRKFSPIRTR